MNVFVLNCGSSSVKGELVDVESCSPRLAGMVERIGERKGRLTCRRKTASGAWDEWMADMKAVDHQAALIALVEVMAKRSEEFGRAQFSAVGHRVVHGGDKLRQPAIIEGTVLDTIRATVSLSPLHNAASLAGIELALARWPSVPQVAVFDTAFHQTLPPHAFHYALPFKLSARLGIRRYGFHGTSHQYVAKRAARLLGRPLEALRLITLHLGNGASAAAIEGGRSIDTTMGFTPLEGLMMSTRSGELDPAIIFHLSRVDAMSLDDIETILKSQSGLKGVCGASDMRDVERLARRGDPQAQLALAMFCYRVRKCVGAYFTVLSGAGLTVLGVALDGHRNAHARGECELQRNDSAVKVLVVPTNEEVEIAEQTLVTCLQSAGETARRT